MKLNKRLLAALGLCIFAFTPSALAAPAPAPAPAPRATFPSTTIPAPLTPAEAAARFVGAKSASFGENLPGVVRTFAPTDRQIALTLDACDGGFDAQLIAYLIKEEIPATIFVSGAWIRRHKADLQTLAGNPLFEIANHGARHLPLAVAPRKAYHLNATGSVASTIAEIVDNTATIHALTDRTPRFFRSGGAHYDAASVEIAQSLGYTIAGFSVNGDAGATKTAAQVAYSVKKAQPGDIILCHLNRPKSGTREGLKIALPALKHAGATFVRLSDVIPW